MKRFMHQTCTSYSKLNVIYHFSHKENGVFIVFFFFFHLLTVLWLHKEDVILTFLPVHIIQVNQLWSEAKKQ